MHGPDWGVDLPSRASGAQHAHSSPQAPDELPEVLEAVAEGYELAPESPLWCFLPAFWPDEHRAWVPDRATRYRTRSCAGQQDERLPWSGLDYREVEADANALLADCGLSPRPAGRLWLLRPPDRFASLDDVLAFLLASTRAAGLPVMATPAFVAHVVADLERLFRGSRGPRTHLGVTALQLAVTAGFVVAMASQAPPPFSAGGWAFILLPPTAFGVAWLLGRRVRVQGEAPWRAALSHAGELVALWGLVLTCLLVPIEVFGSLMDGIG